MSDLIMINSLHHSKVGTQWSKPKALEGQAELGAKG